MMRQIYERVWGLIITINFKQERPIGGTNEDVKTIKEKS